MTNDVITRASRPRSRRLLAAAVAPTLGVGVIVMYAVAVGDLTVLASALMVAGAATLSGGLLGFLFGVPRTAPAEAGADDLLRTQRSRYRANTNLEQISDWLTKILVGVGLTQLSPMRRAAASLIAGLAPALGGGPTSQVYGAALLVYFAVFGFLAAWLTTRLFLAPALTDTERALEAFVAAESEREAGNEERAAQLRQEAIRILDETRELPRRYESLRRSQPPGPPRNAEMEAIVAAVRRSAASGFWSAELVRDMFDEGAEGSRICALGIMQGDVSLADLDRITEAIVDPRSSFEQLHALLTAHRVLPKLSREQQARLAGAVEEQVGAGRIPPTGQRSVVARLILDSIEPLAARPVPPAPRRHGSQ